MGELRDKDNSDVVIRRHFEELVDGYSGLKLSKKKGYWVVRGDLHFSAEYRNYPIEDTFEILLILPKNYPRSPPQFLETGGRIPEEFHTFTNKVRCLGLPSVAHRKFALNPRLLHFVENQVVHYLYAYRFWEDHDRKEMPWGELSHNGEGIYEHYSHYFQIEGILEVLNLLKFLAERRKYRGRIKCPCGSKKRTRDCHGEQLKALVFEDSELFKLEIYILLRDLEKAIKEEVFREVVLERGVGTYFYDQLRSTFSGERDLKKDAKKGKKEGKQLKFENL